MDALKSGWFSELSEFWPGQCFSFEVDEILHHERSLYQDILVFKSKTYGNVLALDGIIQCTERDEFAYHEMMAHLPLFSHPNPKKVLVIGGGDGGTLREITKHDIVEEVHICEIDERVIEISKKYLPSLAEGYNSPKVKVHIKDGIEFLEDHINEFDVVITDSSDPIGPAKPLFEKPYYEKINKTLKPDGILCSQGECIWLDLELISNCIKFCRSIFPVVKYAFTTIPSYPSGQIGFFLASKNKESILEEPFRKINEKDLNEMDLKYYNKDVHRASFVVPQFVRKQIKQ